MKIKNLTVGLLMAGLVLSFAGCGDKTINDKGKEVYSFGQFIEIKSYKFTTSYSNQYIQHFVYDKDSKIVYILYQIPYGTLSWCVGIGRQGRLKIYCWKQRVGSNPITSTVD